MSYFDDVKQFHQIVLKNPNWKAEYEILRKRANFMQEELDEFVTAHQENDMVKMADALADIIYVALGTADILQLPFDAIWKHVHRANMQKELGVTSRGNTIDAVKPEGLVGPEEDIALSINEARRLRIVAIE